MARNSLRKKLADEVKAAYARMNELSGGSLGIVVKAVQHFSETRAPEAAAGMAYYAVFSLFPLLLVLVATGSLALEREQVYEQTIRFVEQALPTSRDLVERNIQQVLQLRGTVGIIGLLGSLWSASGVFAILTRNINLAWPQAEPRNTLEMRLLALGMVIILVILLILSLFSEAALALLPRLQVPVWGDVSIYATPVWAVVSRFVPWLFTFLLFLSLYRWVPNTHVKWSGVLWGALVAAAAWEIAAGVFAWYLHSGLARYRLVYGSLGAVVALMFWIYLSSLITLFGAHLSAAICRESENE